MPTEYGVYGLYRPDGRICYIGKGKSHRPAQHFKYPAKHRNKHLGRIIIAAGGSLRIEWLATGLSERAALLEEVYFIAKIGRAPNGPLVNMTDGGDGVSGLRHSAATKAVLAELASNRGQKRTDEARAKMSAVHMGKKQSPETIEKRAASLRGRKRDPSIAERSKAAQTGRPKNPASIAKMITTMRSPEVIAKISGANHWTARRKVA